MKSSTWGADERVGRDGVGKLALAAEEEANEEMVGGPTRVSNRGVRDADADAALPVF